LKVSRCVFVSTSEAYGGKPLKPVQEDAPLKPVGVYAAHKLLCEQLCLEGVLAGGVPSAVARLSMVRGKGYCSHKPFFSLLDRVAEGRPVILASLGTSHSDMVHLDDANSGLAQAAKKPNAVGEVLHFSASIPASHVDLARTAICCTGSRSRIVIVSPALERVIGMLAIGLRVYDFPRDQLQYLLQNFVLDNTKASRLFGYAR